MRKGAKRNEWSTAETAFLIENAGIMPIRDLCRHLKRSWASVHSKAEWLRMNGYNVCLRHYKSRLETCPSCGFLSGHLGKDGICEPCKRKEQLDAIHARIAEIWLDLPQEDKDKYDESESKTDASMRGPRPKAPSKRDLSTYEMLKRDEEHALAIEAWRIAYLKREIKRVQKRKERIEECARRNSENFSNQ